MSSYILDMNNIHEELQSLSPPPSSSSISVSTETSSLVFSLSDVRRALMKDFPLLTPLMNRISLSYNMKYVRRQDEEKVRIHEQDEIALIPPISGG